MSYTTIRIEDASNVRQIVLHRPERRNAMTPEMQEELISALGDAALSNARVVVLSGAGEAFCSGLDLTVLRAMQDKTAADHRVDAERIGRLFRMLYELPMPTIAAVHGPAIAGGTGLAMVCDFTLATPGSRFGFTEAHIGFVPALVSAFLALQIGDKRSRDLLLSARLFTAEEAHALGLVTEVVSPDALHARAGELAHALMANSPQSLRATKQLLAAQNKVWLDTAIQLALEANASARKTEDFREGINAFLEKRKPNWAE